MSVAPDPARHVFAHVFKITIDPYVGKLGVLRVHQGTLRPAASCSSAMRASRSRSRICSCWQGHREIVSAMPGDICALAKVDELHLDAVLHDSHDEDQYHLKPVAFPPPMLGLAIEPERRGDEQRIADTLHKLTSEDPCLRLEHHASVNETVLYGWASCTCACCSSA